ncbi:hypothetical protein [Oceanospirillum linum]|uniref:Uncharacterized protein n=1 Tax=Oceanospirillum linum TaxID=966 RepID=A0A1T1HEN9_OCELI|nr:hypothetical protein [Oceanospirillum linum]OOV88328.1 hypothetical protein BTA35_0202080 [Oceanospirillum linum]SEF52449.1 hypothetical protein SAMN04489856_101427 [Oleiphilus messinensis]SMP04460.1 hypothetical protein SAMN06264348_101428 [Oceanospirillum linum]
MGFWSSMGNAISSAVSAVGSVCSSIGSGLSSVASTLEPLIRKGLSYIGPVGNVISTVAQRLEVFKSGEDVMEMGDRHIQAKDKGIDYTPNDQTYNEYLEEIRNFELDPEKSPKTVLEKIVTTASGIVLGLKGIEEKMDMADGESGHILRLVVLSPDVFNAEKVVDMLAQDTDFEKIADYFDNKLSAVENRELRGEVFTLIKESDPSLDGEGVYEKLSELKDKEPVA